MQHLSEPVEYGRHTLRISASVLSFDGEQFDRQMIQEFFG
jgi:hypothetical protein